MAMIKGSAFNDFIHAKGDGLKVNLGAYRNKFGVTNGDDIIMGLGNNDVLFGRGGNDVLDGGVGADRMVGGAGNDTYIVDNFNDKVIERAGKGTDTVKASITYVLGANIENLILTGAAIFGTGNELDNMLTGNDGANELDGGAGKDAMAGGKGDDTFLVDDAGDTVVENANEGVDTVKAAVTFTLGANIEKLILTGTGAINGTGNADDNTLTGNDGANVLDGGAGKDAMAGGKGDDTYVVDHVGDMITENANGGIDTVKAGMTYTLAFSIEKLILTGTGAINGTGNELDNTLTGNDGANVLDGADGKDTLQGGDGADTLVGGAGDDTLLSGDGADTLDGGAGKDTMEGGKGDDTYIVDIGGETVTENANEGVDTVKAGVLYALDANVENLLLTGTGNINGIGNDLDNTLTGNAGDNLLSGGKGDDVLIGGGGTDTLVGGEGADNLDGGEGNDFFQIDASDTITDSAGIDTVTVSGFSYMLPDFIENGKIFGNDSRPTLTGNGGPNSLIDIGGRSTLVGGGGDDSIDGGGADDILTGGAGADTFVFNELSTKSFSALDADTITDFATGVDKIDVEDALGISGAVNGVNLVDGSAMNSFNAFETAAKNTFAIGHGKDDIYVAYNVNNSGNAWVLIDADNNGTNNGTFDILLILEGIDTAAKIAAADFI